MQKKYKNQKIVIDGMVFDSQLEAKRYFELKLLERAKKISNLQRQVKFMLIPAQREKDTMGPKGGVKRGKTIERKCEYVADFTYWENGNLVVEDTKGFKTEGYTIKRKLMLWIHNIRIREVK